MCTSVGKREYVIHRGVPWLDPLAAYIANPTRLSVYLDELDSRIAFYTEADCACALTHANLAALVSSSYSLKCSGDFAAGLAVRVLSPWTSTQVVEVAKRKQLFATPTLA